MIAMITLYSILQALQAFYRIGVAAGSLANSA
jgi:hypothetical protein